MTKNKAIILIFLLCFYKTTLSFAQTEKSKAFILIRNGLSINKGKESKTFHPEEVYDKTQNSNSYALSGAIGYRINPQWRIGLNVNYIPKYKITNKKQRLILLDEDNSQFVSDHLYSVYRLTNERMWRNW